MDAVTVTMTGAKLVVTVDIAKAIADGIAVSKPVSTAATTAPTERAKPGTVIPGPKA